MQSRRFQPRATTRTLLVSLAALVLSVFVHGCDRGKKVDLESSPSAESRPAAASAGEEDESSPDRRFETSVEPSELVVDETRQVELEIRAGDGLKINREFPSWSIAVEPDESVELEPSTFESDDLQLEEGRAFATAKMTPRQAGSTSLAAEATFSVCNPDKCHILRDESVAFDVRATDSSSGEGTSE